MVGLLVGLSQPALIFRPLLLRGSSFSVPGSGFHGFGREMFCASICLWFMPLYKNDCAPWPTWLLVPSHLSHPTVHPLENQ